MCTTEFDAKSRGCSKKLGKKYIKLNYVNGGTQERKFNFIKIILNSVINGSAQEK